LSCASLIGVDDQGILFPLWDGNRTNLSSQTAIFPGGGSLGLTPQREAVLVLTADVVFVCQIFGRLWHRVGTVSLLQCLVDESPPHGGIKHLRCAAKGAFRLANHERGA
jgi:hypothetical protein